MPIRSFTDAEVLVSERRRLERPLVILVWIGIALFSLAEGSAFFLLAGSLSAGIKLYAVSRGNELLLRRWLVTAGVLLATVLVLFALLLDTGQRAVVHLGHYVILIQLCKLFERSRNRDYAQVLIMSMVTAMTACILPNPFLSERLWFAIALGLYLTLACHTAMVLTLKRGLDAAVEAALPTESGPLPVHRVAWNVRRDWPAKPLRRAMIPILIAMFSVGALFFLVTPWARGPHFLMPQTQKSISVTGYSNQVQLGDAKVVQLSDQESLCLRATAADANLLGEPLYLRGHVLDNYERSHWFSRATGRYRPWKDAPELDPARATKPAPGEIRQEVRMESGLQPTLFGVAPIHKAWAEGASLEIGPHGEARLSPGGRVPGARVDYVVESAPPEVGSRATGATPSPGAAAAQASFDTEGPDVGDEPDRTTLEPQVRNLARQWCQGLLVRRSEDPNRREEIDLAIARRLADRLRANYSYSLDLSGCDPTADGVEDFLFHMKQGHCEYFASALTVMCRALDVRARLATGFRCDDAGARGEWVIVRARDAHAWTEVYSPRQGWLVFDATPAGAPAPVQKHWYSFFTDNVENAQQFWYLRVIRYSEQDRQEMVKIVQGWWEAVRDAALSLWQGIVNLFVRGDIDEAMVVLVIALGAVAVTAEILVVIHMVRRRTRLARGLRRAAGARWEQVRFLAAFLRFLERRGLGPRNELSLLETASRAEEALGLPKGEGTRLVRLYYRLRWGAQDLTPQEILAAERTVDALRRAKARAGQADATSTA
jgi:transglutaminase-like putative cysteine protease